MRVGGEANLFTFLRDWKLIKKQNKRSFYRNSVLFFFCRSWWNSNFIKIHYRIIKVKTHKSKYDAHCLSMNRCNKQIVNYSKTVHRLYIIKPESFTNIFYVPDWGKLLCRRLIDLRRVNVKNLAIVYSSGHVWFRVKEGAGKGGKTLWFSLPHPLTSRSFRP